MSAGSERWAALRDREALGERLDENDLAELALLEARDPEVRQFAAQMRELESFLDPREGPTPSDRELVDRALSAVQVSSPTLASSRARTVESDAELERVVDPDGPSWIRNLALASIAVMGVAAALALVTYEPQAVPRASHQQAGTRKPTIAPTVEALASARTQKRGAKLRRNGEALPENTQLVQGDQISAGDKPGCMLVEPKVDVCLAPGSVARIASLALKSRSIEVLRGRVVARLEAEPSGAELELWSGEVHTRALGTVFGVEASGEGNVRVRVLRGRVRVLAYGQTREVSETQAALLEGATRRFELAELLPGQAQREWDLLATGQPASAPASPAPAPAVGEPRESDASPTAAPARIDEKPELKTEAPVGPGPSVKAPRELLKDAWDLLKEKRWAEAARVYEAIEREHPQSDEAHVVLVRLGDLSLEHLQKPGDALAAFERYLREGGGPLEAEARYGRIQALAALGRKTDERKAIEEFLRAHPTSLKAASLRERLRDTPR